MIKSATETDVGMDSLSQPARANLGAVVMGGDYRALALTRSLGRHGINVWVINQSEQRLAGISRYARRTLFYPSWDDKNGVNYLLEIGRRYSLNGWLLFPTSDDSVVVASTHHEQLSKLFQITVPPWDTLKWACDKRLMHQLADTVGVDHPRTFYPHSRGDLQSLELEFPLILKPASREHFNRLTVDKAWRVDDLETLLARYDEACKLMPSEMLMVQEVIPGGGETQFSYAGVYKDGRPLASLVARRTRQIPMDFGRASTFVETVEDPGVVGPAVSVLQAIRFTGLAEVEFKRDPRNGQFKLIDINPRVWGWYSLCGRAGVDFGYLLWLLLQDKPIPFVHACSGERWMRMSTDFLTSLPEICSGRMSVRDYLRSLVGPKESAIFASDDPWPGLLEIPMLFYIFSMRILQGRGI